MILSITLNPLLEIRLKYDIDIDKEVIRDGDLTYAAGGKGVNVARQLRYLDQDSLVFTTASGLNGKRFTECLEKDQIKSIIYKTLEETRISVVVNNGDTQKNFFARNSGLTESERSGIVSKLSKAITTVDTVVISGSTPDSGSIEIVAEILKLTRESDKLTLLDTYGSGLAGFFKLAPVIIHNNFQEIENSLGLTLKTEAEIITAIKMLHSKGIKLIYLTDGKNPFYASNNGYIYRVSPPQVKEVSSTGCGDAFTAGILYSMNSHYKFEEGLKFATALGALEATKYDVCKNDLSEIQSLLDRVIVEPVGKRMNEFNVPRAN